VAFVRRSLRPRRALFVFATLAWAFWCPGASASGQSSPVPLINQPLVPASATPGGAGFTLTVNGTGFATGAVVNWNGSPLATTFVGRSQLMAAVPASDIAAPGTAFVSVVNPGPGRASNAAFFEVTTATPAVAFSASTAAVGQGPAAMVAGDFNGDGKIDLAVANRAASTVSILLDNGDGTFRSHVDYPVAANPATILTGDFNNDGKLDLVVGNSILLGNGDGTFQPFLAVSISGALAADFNGDGKLDLAALVQNGSGTVISVALGNGDGTFQPPVVSATMVQPGAPASLSATAGDFNGDGKLDLAVASLATYGDAGSLFVHLGNGDGTFEAGSLVTNSLSFFNPTWVGVADLNGDGKLDLVATSCFTRDTLAVSYPVFLGKGDGTFTVAAGGAAPAGNFACPASGVIADFNGDGQLDLAALNPPAPNNPSPPGPDDNTVSILLSNGDGSLQAPVEFPTGSLPDAAGAGDFNGDGRLDLAVANHGDNTVSIFLQRLPTITVSSLSLSFFGYVGSTTPAQTLSVTNISGAPLDITGVSINGDFAETNTCGTPLAAGAGCTVSVTFTATTDGQRKGTLTISFNGAGSPWSIPLKGTRSPHLVTSTTQLDFGFHEIGTTSSPQTVTLTNAGVEPVTIEIALSGSDPLHSVVGFAQTNTCGSTLGAGSSCLISVTFTPNAMTQSLGGTDLLSINHIAADGTEFGLSVTLTGTATTTAVVVSPSSIDFGYQAVGSASPPQTVTFANASNRPLAIRRIFSAPSGLFEQTNNCPATLAPGASCSIEVTFTSKSKGHSVGFLFILDAAEPRALQLVRLSGTGQ
jgi:VCBS repeat protein/centrosomal CEP192-like protein